MVADFDRTTATVIFLAPSCGGRPAALHPGKSRAINSRMSVWTRETSKLPPLVVCPGAAWTLCGTAEADAYLHSSYDSSGDETWPVQTPCSFDASSVLMS
jgi:hypothetical protein